MKKRSFFFKEYLTHFILIVVAFTLAGSVFYHQMASYALRAKQTPHCRPGRRDRGSCGLL